MSDRATLAPLDLASTWQQEFPGTPGQLRHLRAELRTLLDGCPATDDVALLLTELASNAIAFSASGGPGGIFTVRLRHVPGDHILAEVQDAGGSWHGDIARSAGDAGCGSPPRTTRMASRSKRPTWTSCWIA